MKIITRTFLVEHEDHRYRVEFNATGMIAHRITPRHGIKDHVDLTPVEPSDPVVPALSSLGDECIAADPNAARYREALTNLAKADGSGYAMFGSAGAAMMSESVRKYCNHVLDGGKAET